MASSIHKLLSKEELIEKFSDDDYTIFGLMLSISVVIGIFFFFRSGNSTTEDILLGSRSMGLFPMTLSLIASFMSAITLLGTPAEIYTFGTAYSLLVLSYPLIMASTAYIYLPVFFKLNLNTSYEYLEHRFSKIMRIIGSLCFTLQMVLYMAIVVYAPALALEQITGLQVKYVVPVIFIVCAFYTTIGGMKAVMWTDAFQSFMMFGSFLAIIIKGNADAGGFTKIFEISYNASRIVILDFDFSMSTRHTFWGMIVGGYFTWLSVYAINQTQVQRYLSVATIDIAVKGIWWNILGISSLLLMCSYAGLVAFAFYENIGCDPIKSKLVSNKDQIFPIFVMQVMGDIPCIPGLFVAGVFSGALSSVSSGLNSLASVTLSDFVESGCNVKLSNFASTLLTRCLSIVYAVVAYLFVFIVQEVEGVLEAALGIFGIVGGPILGAVTLGMCFPWANNKGAICGTIVSLILTMWIGFGQIAAKISKSYYVPNLPTTITNCPAHWNLTSTLVNVTQQSIVKSNSHLEIYNISYVWYSAIATTSCIVVGMFVSLLTGTTNVTTLNPDYISPALRNMFNCYPKFLKVKWQSFFDTIGSKYIPPILENKKELSKEVNEAFEFDHIK